MTRIEFLDRLRQGLNGLPPETVTDIMNDYEAHFADAAAAGRSEAEVAAALGDPGRLARELRAEAGVKSWETAKTPSSAVGAVIAILGLGALDIMFLIPFLMGLAGTLVGILTASIGVFIAGGVLFAAGPFMGLPGGIAGALMGGLGLMAGGVAAGALIVALGVWLVNGIIWYARLHYRVLKPALDA